jgi:hypothetical protein
MKEIESLGHGIYSMDPKAKHEEEHEDSKKEREARTTNHCIKNHKIVSLI